jgi:tetratricopeptide (TPR) repeat protein
LSPVAILNRQLEIMSSNSSSANERQKNLQTVEVLVAKWKDEGNDFYHHKNYRDAVDKYSKIVNLLKLQHALFQPSSLPGSDWINENQKQSLMNILYVSYSNRCACYLQLNEVQLALKDAQECVSLKSDWPKGYNRLANCLIRLDKYDEALAAYQQLLLIDPGNRQEIQNSIDRVNNMKNGTFPQQQNNSSSQSRSPNNQQPQPTTDYFASISNFFQTVSQYVANIRWSESIQQLYYRALTWYMTLSDETRRYFKIAVAGIFLYYFFLSSFFSFGSSDAFSSSHRQSSRYYNSGYDSYSSSYSQGFSLTTWIAIIAGAYFVPPLLPDLLGPQYARPFFGLNFTTFIWLIRMFSGSGMGGFGMGGYNNRRRRYF